MTLFEKLKQARSEEDVKDAYIKALGLKGVSKNLIKDANNNPLYTIGRTNFVQYDELFPQIDFKK